MAVIGREPECLILDDFLSSNKPEFIAVYGRRRVDKTYLVREYFKNKKVIFFNTTGSKDGTALEQISHFTKEIGNVFNKGLSLKPGKNWDETFELLTKAINTIPKNKNVVLFLMNFLGWQHGNQSYYKHWIITGINIGVMINELN